MKEKMDYKSLNELIKIGRILLKILLVVAVVGLVILGFGIIEKTQILSFIGNIFRLLLPLFLGLGIAWLFEPMIKKLETKKISRGLSTTIVYLSFVLILVLLLVLVIPEFVSQLKELIGQIPQLLTSVKDFITKFFENFKNTDMDIEAIKNNITMQLENFANNLTTNSLSGLIDSVTSFITESFSILLGILIGFYLSLDFKKVVNWVDSLIPDKYATDVKGILHNLDEMARGYVSGTLFTSLIVAILTFLGLVIAGISSPLLFAIFCGVTNIIPYFGPYIGGIPTIIVAFSISPICGIIVLVTIVLVQFIEGNIIHPLVVGKAVDIHPVTIVITLIIFEYYFGIMGMILATPIVGSIKILFNYFNKRYHFTEKIKPNKIEVK